MNSINPEWEISVQDAEALMANRANEILFLDVRKPEEYQFCRLQGAHLVPLSQLPATIDDLQDLAAGRQIITYCHHGIRSLSAAAILRDAGFVSVKSMAGGIDQWSLQIDPSVPRY